MVESKTKLEQQNMHEAKDEVPYSEGMTSLIRCTVGVIGLHTTQIWQAQLGYLFTTPT